MTTTRQMLIAMAGFLGAGLATAEEAEPTRLLSADIADALATTFAYEPPPPPPPTAETEQAGLAQPERKNQIIRLPRVVVEGERPPIFREQDIYTPEGLRELALKRYVGDAALALNAWRIPLLGGALEARALLEWQEDERLRVMNEIKDEIKWDATVGESERSKDLQEILRDTYFRPMHVPHAGKIKH